MPQNKKEPQFYVPGKQATTTTELSPVVTSRQPVTNAQLQNALDEELNSRFVKPVVSGLGWVTDQLSRGQYASAKFFDSNTNDAKSVYDSFVDAFNEFKSPQEKMSFSDLIHKRNPQYAKDNPKSTAVLGFLADVALDPLSYLGVGLAKKGLAIGGKTLSNNGTNVLKTGLNLVKSEERSVELADKVTDIRKFLKSNNATLPDEEIFDLAKKELDTIYNKIPKETKQRLGQLIELPNTKIVDNAGNPLPVFHGTKKSFKEFARSGSVMDETDLGFFFTPDPDIARTYAGGMQGAVGGNIRRAFLDIRNPFVTNTPPFVAIGIPKSPAEAVALTAKYKKDLLSKGYDGIIVKDKFNSNTIREVIAFEPNQIKDAYVNPLKTSENVKRLTQNLDLSYTPSEIRETVEDRIARIAAIPQNEKLKLFEKEGLRLTVGVPFGKQYDLPGSRLALKALGLDALQNTIRTVGRKLGTTTPGNVIGRTFVKEFDPNKEVPEEFWDRLHQIENTFDSNVDSVVRTTQQMNKNIKPERQDVIGQTMADIRDAAYLKEESLGRPLTQQEANTIKSDALTAAKLTPEEHAVVAQYYQDYAKMQELEMRAGLLDSEITNYSPRSYELLKDPQELSDLVRNKNGSLSTNLSSSKQTKYRTLAESIADGNVPELNAAVLYANRLINSREKLAAANFNETTRKIFGLPEGNKQLTSKELAQLPKVVQSNIRMLGDAVYPSGIDDNLKTILNGIDIANSWFKRGAYGIKPSAAPRQAVSNAAQSAMEQGLKAFKAFDPRAALDAGGMLLEKTGNTLNLPPFFQKFFNKHAASTSDAILAQRIALDKIVGAERLDSFSNNFKLKSALGQEYDGKYLKETMLRDGVIKGFDASGNHIATKVERALSRNTDSIGQVAKELAKFWRWPQLTEDYARAMNYLNGLRMGYSEKDALKMVNKTLFDYSNGLSYVERNVFKRLVPFYTFPRFAIPFVFKSLVTKPGNAITGEKLMRLMEKMMTKDSLTAAEQEALPGYIIEQPRVFSGFDKDGKAYFNIFNNMTPVDALSLLVHDKYGNIDYQRTMEKTILAQMTPFLKVPLESVVNKNFFTGQAIDKAGKLGDINESTLGASIPDAMKDLMGWENRINPQTGRANVYINPYLAHTAMSFVPGLKTWVIDPSDQGLSELERAMELIMGVKTNKVDLKESADIKALSNKKELNRLRSAMRGSKIKGSTSEYNKAYQDYQKLIQAIQESNKAQGIIRGQGLNPTEPQQ